MYRLHKWLCILFLLMLCLGVQALNAQDASDESGQQNASVESNGQWFTKASSEFVRQEVSYVHVNGKFYLAGGDLRQEMYNPVTDAWTEVAPLPISGQPTIDHIQGVAVNGLIYYIGGLFSWPSGDTNTVYIYNPPTDTFTQGANMASGRGRGAGGVAVYNGKIYYAGGLHNGVVQNWFDVYDPASNTWSSLPNMPFARDHFQAAVVNDKFYAIAGRQLYINFTLTQVDVYDFGTGLWSTASTALPTPRGGFATAVLGSEILVIGGETIPPDTNPAHHEVEAYNVLTNSWRTLTHMPTGRHGIQAAVCNGAVYIVAGGLQTGGSVRTNVQEVFTFDSLVAPCTVESPANASPVQNYYTTSTPTLTWNRVSWATAYQLQIADNSTFTNPCCIQELQPNEFQWTPTLTTGTWYWRVRAHKPDSSTWGAWSQTETLVIS